MLYFVCFTYDMCWFYLIFDDLTIFFLSTGFQFSLFFRILKWKYKMMLDAVSQSLLWDKGILHSALQYLNLVSAITDLAYISAVGMCPLYQLALCVYTHFANRPNDRIGYVCRAIWPGRYNVHFVSWPDRYMSILSAGLVGICPLCQLACLVYVHLSTGLVGICPLCQLAW